MLVDEGVDALPEHVAGLRIGREQARQIFNGPFEARLGAMPQGPLEQRYGDGDEADRRDECFDGGEGQAKIGRSADAEAGQRNEDVNQALHGHPAPEGDSAPRHSIATAQREASRHPLFTVLVNTWGSRQRQSPAGKSGWPAIAMHIVAERQFDCVRLLLVDRSATAAAAFAAGIEASAPALSVTAAGSGRRAAECLRAQAFDVVLLDLASLREIAEEPRDAVSRLIKLAGGALVIALSGDSSVSATVEVMRAGAHDCVTRGIEPLALARHIACLARRHGKTRMLSLIGNLADAALPDPETIASASHRPAAGRAADVAAGTAHHRRRDLKLCRQYRAGGGGARTQPLDHLPEAPGLGGDGWQARRRLERRRGSDPVSAR